MNDSCSNLNTAGKAPSSSPASIKWLKAGGRGVIFHFKCFGYWDLSFIHQSWIFAIPKVIIPHTGWALDLTSPSLFLFQKAGPCQILQSTWCAPCRCQRNLKEFPGKLFPSFSFLFLRNVQDKRGMLTSIYPSALRNLKYNCFCLLLFLLIQYNSEGKSRRERDASVEARPHGDRTSYFSHRGHEFILTLYHFPSNCEVCTRPLWDVFKPPPALECRHCNAKFHRDHLDKKEKVIVPCKGQHAEITHQDYDTMFVP